MRIRRNSSQLTFRKRQRRGGGWLPFVLLLSIIVGMLIASRDWIGQWLNFSAPGQQDTSIQHAEEAFANGDLETTIRLTRLILETEPDHHSALILLVRALIYRSYSDYDRATDRQVALEVTTAAITQDPDDPDLLAIHAYTLQANGRSDEASRLALRVITEQPEHIVARITLSLAYGGQGIFEAALREGQQAVALTTTTSTSWKMDAQRVLAIAHSDLAHYGNALDSIAGALQLNRRLIPLYFERALYALQIGDSDTATVAYFQILAFDPDNVKVRLRLCELSSTMREREAAIQYCTEVTEHAPGWSDGWYHLGHEYFLQGNFSAARDSLNRCSTLEVMQQIPIPDRRFECWYLQGQAAEILGDCESLLATYNEFRAMAASDTIVQTWTYPPEGPPGCATISTTQN